MPYCRNCHKEISKFDNDICPYCGTESPIDSSYKTMDVTAKIDPTCRDFDLYKAKSKKKVVLFCGLLGFFGVHNFYLGFKKKGLLDLIVTLVLIAGIGCALFFTVLPNALAFIVPWLLIWLYYGVRSFLLSRNDSLKDANGEFLH